MRCLTVWQTNCLHGKDSVYFLYAVFQNKTRKNTSAIKKETKSKEKMKKYIAYCGLDCEKCDARKATVNNDDTLREKVAKLWSELNGVKITSEMINCSGCRSDGGKDCILRFALPNKGMCYKKRLRDLRRLQ